MTETFSHAMHEKMAGMLKLSIVDEITMREFESIHYPSVKKLSKEQVKKIRKKTKCSQTVFAKLLNTTKSTVAAWERGDRKSNGISLKVLDIVDKQGIEALL